MYRTKAKGLTLIEIMIALSLLGIMTGVVVSSLAGSFQITRTNRRVLEATAAVQGVVEQIRGQWQQRARYDNNCATLDLTPDSSSFLTLTAKVLTLSSSAAVPTGSTPADITVTDCDTLAVVAVGTLCPANALLKRVTVIAVDNTASNKEVSRANLDIACEVAR